MNLYFFTYGSTNNTVESLSTNESTTFFTEDKKIFTREQWHQQDPRRPPGPSKSTTPDFLGGRRGLSSSGRRQYSGPCNVIRRPDLDARKGHSCLLPMVSKGLPSQCNGLATISPRVPLSQGAYRPP